jgi:hypothetical protein
MTDYSRLMQHEGISADQILALLLNYPRHYQARGITLGELLQQHKEILKDGRSVKAALELLAEEGKVRLEKSGGHLDVLDTTRIYPV